MAICRKYLKPDFFITFTCNPHWEEITDELKPGETAQDRPELVSRVFKMKKDLFVEDLVKNGIFGRMVAHLYVIEYQVVSKYKYIFRRKVLLMSLIYNKTLPIIKHKQN